MSSLEYLDLQSSELDDEIPDTIGDMGSLAYLDLFRKSTGSIPDTVGKMVLLSHLDLSQSTAGSIPDTVGKMVLLSHLDLSAINCRAPFQIQLGTWFLLKNSISLRIIFKLAPDFVACANDTLETLSLSDNQFNGSVPALIGFSSLRELHLDFNQLNGTLPESVGQLANLQSLDIASNSLQGTINEAHLFNLSQLSYLDLSSNSLTFNMSLECPPRLVLECNHLNCHNLELSGKIPEWIGGSLPNLIVLNLGSNRFSGVICPELCQLKNIQILDLSSNNILGVVPRCVGGFTAMTKKGSLVIAHNYSFTRCRYHKASLVEISDLSVLDLSDNNLSGKIPQGTQLQSFNIDSYKGNPALCGLPLLKKTATLVLAILAWLNANRCPSFYD
ncbi:LRR receptor-like serine/threonine-protein kinase ERECTA [Vitis vinifera]|uniref:LRR receptor-like serine/threonine-protein kinase ERECTA n=1 Tax=Vitis vinifera TaxID=29760 RepID=A0A438CUE4_VITVI|nr:LRR receptor-like serine/threonine-protein kinase ERECTA [Vitis vinifera]